MAGLEGFFKGFAVGADQYGKAEDDALRRAKAKLALNALEDDYADEQVLAPYAMRNAVAQYDLDTANRSANLDTLYKTHDGFVEATQSQNTFARDDYDNKVANLLQNGQLKIDSDTARYNEEIARNKNLLNRIKLLSNPQNQLDLTKIQNQQGTADITGSVIDQTKPLQIQTGVQTVKNEGAKAGNEGVRLSNEGFDLDTKTMTQQPRRLTAIADAKKNQTVAELDASSAEATAPIVQNTRYINAQGDLVDAQTGLIEGKVKNTVAGNTASQRVDIATNQVNTEQMTEQQKLAEAKITNLVSGLPDEQVNTALTYIVNDESYTLDERRQAQIMLNKRLAGEQQIKERIQMVTQPEIYLYEKGVNIEDDMSKPEGNYLINGVPVTRDEVASLAVNLASTGKPKTDEAIKQANTLEEIQIRSNEERLTNALNTYRKAVANELELTGSDGLDAEGINRLKTLRQSLGIPPSLAPIAGEGAVSSTPKASGTESANTTQVDNPMQSQPSLTPEQQQAKAMVQDGINKGLWIIQTDGNGRQYAVSTSTGKAMNMQQMASAYASATN